MLANPDIKQKTSYVGNSVKSMHLSVEASLKNLRTSYIDILYVHWVRIYGYPRLTRRIAVLTTFLTVGLQDQHRGGRERPAQPCCCRQSAVPRKPSPAHNLYLQPLNSGLQGISDAPAWVVSQANTYARLTGKTPFVIYQGAWSVLQRDFEREIIPMVRAQGMALAPWNVLAGGKIRTDAEEARRRETGEKGALHRYITGGLHCSCAHLFRSRDVCDRPELGA